MGDTERTRSSRARTAKELFCVLRSKWPRWNGRQQATDGAVALRLGFMRNVLSMARQPPANPSDTFLKPFDTATGVRNEEDSGEVVSPMSTAESSSFRIPAGIAIEDEAVVVSDEPQLVEQECNEVATKKGAKLLQKAFAVKWVGNRRWKTAKKTTPSSNITVTESEHDSQLEGPYSEIESLYSTDSNSSSIKGRDSFERATVAAARVATRVARRRLEKAGLLIWIDGVPAYRIHPEGPQAKQAAIERSAAPSPAVLETLASADSSEDAEAGEVTSLDSMARNTTLPSVEHATVADDATVGPDNTEDLCSGSGEVVREDIMASNSAQTTLVVATAALYEFKDLHSGLIEHPEVQEVTRLEYKASKTAWPAQVDTTVAPDTPQAHHGHASHAEVDTAATPDSSEDMCSASFQLSEAVEEMTFNVVATVSPAVDQAARDNVRHAQQVQSSWVFHSSATFEEDRALSEDRTATASPQSVACAPPEEALVDKDTQMDAQVVSSPAGLHCTRSPDDVAACMQADEHHKSPSVKRKLHRFQEELLVQELNGYSAQDNSVFDDKGQQSSFCNTPAFRAFLKRMDAASCGVQHYKQRNRSHPYSSMFQLGEIQEEEEASVASGAKQSSSGNHSPARISDEEMVLHGTAVGINEQAHAPNCSSQTAWGAETETQHEKPSMPELRAQSSATDEAGFDRWVGSLPAYSPLRTYLDASRSSCATTPQKAIVDVPQPRSLTASKSFGRSSSGQARARRFVGSSSMCDRAGSTDHDESVVVGWLSA